ncbi:MAG: 4Fe-4S dicluster domain-containing protein [Kiritimatiellia bacterium]|nr:4Fe-4S dicluster domain-containing protein [Kiritimatiellia bacterium]
MSKRNQLRLFVLLCAVLLGSPLLPWAMGRLPPPYEIAPRWSWLHRLPLAPASALLTNLSPFLVLGGLIGGIAATWWGGLALLIGGISVRRGRWFCHHLCPTGLLADGLGRLNPRAASRLKTLPNAGPWLLWIALGSALFGYPLFLWMDPLSLLNGFLGAWRLPMAWSAAAPAFGLIAILALSAWRPRGWCYRFCPLGALQDGLGRIGQRFRKGSYSSKEASDSGRRKFFALGSGALAGWAAHQVLPRFRSGGPVLRPPGAASESRFNALCARCGNCLRACPQKIIHAAGGEAGFDGFLTPVLRIEPGYCAEYCRECNRVCPTAALRPLSLKEKHRVAIGAARVHRDRCIAWAQGEYCMVCDEYCPYKAIGAEEKGGVACPVVDEERCRGCGLCQTVCPGIGPAIRVEAHPAQRKLAE